MNPTPHEETLFQAALPLVAAERAALLDRECAGDAALRARLDALLAAHDQADTLFGTQAGAARPTLSLDLAHDLADDLVGETIGRYKLLEKIGEGGCGVVYVAEQTEPVRRRVALKIIKLGMDTKQVVARFEAERQALAMMDHPNIAKVFDAGTTDGGKFEVRKSKSEGSPKSEGGSKSESRSPKSEGGSESESRSPKLGVSTSTFDLRPSDFHLRPSPSALRTSNVALPCGRPYFVMELVRGIRITDYCDQEQLSTRDRLDLFVQVCHAIQHAHQKGIIHRDIKPSNILVTLHDGVPVPKVIDFGIAKATQGRLTDATIYTQLHQFIGTPAYMSPEQAEMTSLDIDTRCDIYSLGVLLYELLTGKTPFDAQELMSQGIEAMRRMIREQDPQRPSTKLATLQGEDLTTTAKRRSVEASKLAKLLSGDLDWIVMKCLEKDRTRRYETANGLAADLKRHLENEPVVARPPSPLYRFQKAWRRHRVVFAAGTTVTVALLLSVVVLAWSLGDQKVARRKAEAAEVEQGRERARAEAARQTASDERDRAARLLSVSQAVQGVELLAKQDPTGLLYLLEARKTVDHLPEDRQRRTLLWSGWAESLARAAETEPEATNRLFPSGNDASRPWVVAGSTNGEITVRDPEGGALRATIQTGSRPVSVEAISANSRLLLANVSGARQLWDLAPVRSNQPPVRLVRRIMRHAFDPQHRRLVTFANEGLPLPGEPPETGALESKPPVNEVQLWDSEAGSPLVATWEGDRHDLGNHQFALSPDGTKVAAGWHVLALFDARTGRAIPPPLSTNVPARGRSFFVPPRFSANGRWLWDVWETACVRYDPTTGELAGTPFGGLNRWIQPWATPDGRHMVLSLTNGFQVLDLDAGGALGPIIPRDEDTATRALALSPDGRHLATTGTERGFRTWDTASGEPVGEPLVLPSPPTGAAFSPDGRFVTVLTSSGRSQVHPLKQTPPPISRFYPGRRLLGFDNRGRALAYTDANRELLWCDPWTGTPASAAWKVPGSGRLIGFALSRNRQTLAAAIATEPERSVIRFWDTLSGTAKEPAIAWTDAGALAFSADGRLLAGVGGGNGSIHVWDTASGERRAVMSWQEPPQVGWYELQFSPDARFVAARNSYALSVWDLAAQQFATGSTRDFYLAISQDWRLAVTDRQLLDFSDPREPRPAPAPPTSRSTPADRGGLALSPDGRLRFSGRLWETDTGRPVGREIKPSGFPMLREFSPDSRLLFTHARDLGPEGPRGPDVLQIWDTSTGLPCGPAVPTDATPIGLAFDPGIRWLGTLTLHDDRGAHVFRLPVREISLAEMERRTWLAAGRRFDEAGDLEVLTDTEIRRIERATSPPTAPSPAPAATLSPPPERAPEPADRTALTGPQAHTLPKEIRDFIAGRERRVRSLAENAKADLPPEAEEYFRNAKAGQWGPASNAYAHVTSRLEKFPPDDQVAALFAIRQPLLEAHLALEWFTQAEPRFANAFGRDITASIPAGSIYFGGTDPGRGLVTAFAKFPPDPGAICVLTQNALADGSYLDYLRQTYSDRFNIPTPGDLQQTFQEYITDAQRRHVHDRDFPSEPKQLRPGEEVRIADDGRVQISGQVAVMSLNALLARVLFDRNPRAEFYVEESFPLDWMYPHLEPHGLILKLNRQPLDRLSADVVRRDHEFWTAYIQPLVGDWLKEETAVAEVCAFVERVFLEARFEGFSGDPAFVKDSYARKAFSKLRGSLAGLYHWRADTAGEETERDRMRRAADFAFRQAWVLGPSSPEIFSRYTASLTSQGRLADARRVARVAARFPESRVQAARLITTLGAGNESNPPP